MAAELALIWDPSFGVGDAVIDAQHRHIVELINALYQAAGGEGCSTADVVVDHIGRFLQHHFETEEAFLRNRAYADLERHVAEHHALLSRINRAADQVRAGEQTDERFAGTVWSSLHEHTVTWDREYAKVLSNR